MSTNNEERTHEYPKMREGIDPQDQDPLARYEHRAVATRHAMHWLRPNPDLDAGAALVAKIIWDTAEALTQFLGDGIELSAGLRKLLEAKDALVRQALEDGD